MGIAVHRIFVKNPLKNINYIIFCQKTKEALVLDPYDWNGILKFCKKEKLNIKLIVNTHEHWDHGYGNEKILEATKATLCAPFKQTSIFGSRLKKINGGETITLGEEIELKVLSTPGHTFNHISLTYDSEQKIFFSGDTLFNSGVGHCRSGGDPKLLFKTITDLKKKLSPDFKVFSGHDYAENNLKFTLHVDPDNKMAKDKLDSIIKNGSYQYSATLAEEKVLNLFLQCENETLFKNLRRLGFEINDNPLDAFLHLRELRDNW